MKTPATIASVALVAGSCAAFQRGPAISPEEHPWTEVRSDHFILETDLDEIAARKTSEELEAIFSALANVCFAAKDLPELQIEIVLFRSVEESELFNSKIFTGRFHSEGGHDFELRPLAVLGGNFVSDQRETLQHELTHFFVGYYYPQAAPWLNEGFAEYMETLALEDAAALVGRQPLGAIFWNGERTKLLGPHGTTWALPKREAIRPSRLHQMSPDEFYADPKVDPTSDEGQDAVARVHAHYSSAWTLVRMLLTQPAYAQAFGAYLRSLREGDADAAAWENSLRPLEARLEADYEAALAPKEVLVTRTSWSPPPYAERGRRRMTAADVHVLLARIRPDTAEGRVAARQDLEAARKRDGFAPSNPEFALVAAFWLLGEKKKDQAEATVRQALAAHPDDPRLWNALGEISTLGGSERCLAPAARESFRSIAERLAPIARSAAQFHLLARAKVATGESDAALDYERRALRLDPSCVGCLMEVADISYDQGRFREAFDAATRARGLTLERGSQWPEIRRLMEKAKGRLQEASAPDRAHGAAGAPRASQGKVLTGGRIAPEEIQRVVRANFDRLRDCYEDGLRKNCTLHGRIVTEFAVGLDGRVLFAADEGSSDLPDPDVVACAVRQFEAMRFPAPEGGPITIVYPIEFQPGD
jgi:tetratricopeptide (TPR) repeat protein